METFSTKSILLAASLIADHVETIADRLNSADGQLGDGDLGITVLEGWREIANTSSTFPDDVGMAFLECSKCFQRVSSSSFGTLVATAFMSAAKQCKGQTSIPFNEVSSLLDGACTAMMSRGKSELGSKTVLDAIHAMAIATKDLGEQNLILAECESAIDATLCEFRDKPNKIGRARMYGEKSIGLDDPGMLAMQEMVRGLAKMNSQ